MTFPICTSPRFINYCGSCRNVPAGSVLVPVCAGMSRFGVRVDARTSAQVCKQPSLGAPSPQQTQGQYSHTRTHTNQAPKYNRIARRKSVVLGRPLLVVFQSRGLYVVGAKKTEDHQDRADKQEQESLERHFDSTLFVNLTAWRLPAARSAVRCIALVRPLPHHVSH